MNGIGKIFETKFGGLIFSVASGCAYFIILLSLVLVDTPSAGLLGFFFFPAIVCGIGLVLMKIIRKLADEEQFGKINIICWLHIVLMLISLIFLADLIF